MRMSLAGVAFVCIFTAAAVAAEPAGIVGQWMLRDAPDGRGLCLQFNSDGSGKIGDADMHYALDGNRLNVRLPADLLSYTFILDQQNTLIVSGGDLDAPTAFVRKTAARAGIGGHLPAAAPGTQPAMGQAVTDTMLLGKWQSSDGAVFEFRGDGTLVFNGKTSSYSVANNMLSIQAPDGRIDAPFTIQGRTLLLSVNGQTQNLARVPDAPPAAPADAAIPAGHIAAPIENKIPLALANKTNPIGQWQESNGEVVRFNADGTMQLAEKIYRYTARPGQLLIATEGGTVTWPFDLNGDRLTLSVSGQATVLTRITAPPQNIVPTGPALRQTPAPKAEK